ncbi:MAG: DUF1573 domain-containing protein [Ginsengibacter sp.]
MKKLFTITFCLTLSIFVTAQTSVSKVSKKDKNTTINSAPSQTAAMASTVVPGESLTLKEVEYDFGKIPQGKPVTHDFVFTNTGNTPFALDNVRASCGCTTPEWNKDTIPVGASAIIKVGYNAANEGSFTKPVTITYNGDQVKQIIIKGEVWKTPVTSAPINTSLNSLKNDQ